MTLHKPISCRWKMLSTVSLTVLSLVFAVQSDAAPPPAQRTFLTPREAAEALIQAAAGFDVPALMEILGPDAKDLIATDDVVQDKSRAAAFVAMARDKYSISFNPKNHKMAELVVGNDEWPLPIPIVRRNDSWYFDSKSGRQEILFRRIGQNELDAIVVCRGFVEAQQEYALTRHGDSQVNEYAQRIISSPEKQDGLAWQDPDGDWAGPVGPAVAKAVAQGYDLTGTPYHGYYFKVLKGQGPAAPHGAINFVLNGAMIGGFALAAAPAQYRVSGVETFIVSQDGIVYQKDLGPNTLTIFKDMTQYDPDKTWRRTDDESQ
jgi:Protein of unknown function (DUF2950)